MAGPEQQSHDPLTPHPARERAASVLQWLKAAGLNVEWAEKFVEFWRHVGVVKTTAILIALATPLAKYEWLPGMASSAAATFAEGYGIELEVEDWTADLMDLRVTAHGVKVKTRGQYGRAEILQADSAAIDMSAAAWWRTGQWVRDIEIERPILYLERLLSGRWNWEDIIDVRTVSEVPRLLPPEEDDPVSAGQLIYAVLQLATFAPYRPAPDPDANAPAFDIARVAADGLRVEWVENLPGDSGGGIIHSSKASIYIDDVVASVEQMAGPIDPRPRPTRFSLEGRTADGRISVTGAANFFRWAEAPPAGGPDVRVVSNQAAVDPSWSPSVQVAVYLENVGTTAFGRMVPGALLIPASGTMTGRIELAVEDRRVECRTDLTLRDVSYVANPAAARVPGLARGLDEFRANRRVLAGCEGDLSNERYRPLYAVQGVVTRAAVEDAPPAVKQAAEMDRERLTGKQVVNTTIETVANDLASQLVGKAAASMMGEQAGRALSNALTGEAAQPATPPRAGQRQQNPVSRGIKGIGSGVKKLFGK
jgi:hypothetical protein